MTPTILYAGTEVIKVPGKGTVKITPKTGPNKCMTFTLKETLYIPDMHTNIVCYRRLSKAGYK